MSQNTRKEPSENQDNSGRENNNHQRKRHEGFEGMNYEQKRQPYPFQQTGRNNRNNNTDNCVNRRD